MRPLCILLFLVGAIGQFQTAHFHQLGDRHKLQAQLFTVVLHRVGQHLQGVIAVQVEEDDGAGAGILGDVGSGRSSS